MVPLSHQLSLKLIERCPSCHVVIPSHNIHILDESETNMLAHLSCPNCLTNYLTYIVNHPHGLVGNALLTDMSYEETLSFVDSKPMTDDEFLSLYTLIQRNDFLKNIHQSNK